MVSANTLCKNVLNVKNIVIENFNLYSDEDGVKHIRIKARHHFYIKYSYGKFFTNKTRNLLGKESYYDI